VAGSILALKGELGSGKTLFTQGLVAGLESDAAVTSPDFYYRPRVSKWEIARLPFRFFSPGKSEISRAAWTGRLFF